MLYRTYLILFFCFFYQVVQGQESTAITPSQLGFSGLIYTPSAYLNEWKTLELGFTHFSKETSFTYLAGQKSERAFIVNLVFIPRVELSVKLTRPYSNIRPDYQPNSGQVRNWGIGDRSYSLRVQILKEKENRPALLIGVQDPFANLAYFNTNYLVASKSFEIKELSILTNIGYGISWEETRGDYLQGLFGGVQVAWQNINGSIEYDTNNLNIGFGYQFKNRLFLNLALVDVKHFSGNIIFRHSLK